MKNKKTKLQLQYNKLESTRVLRQNQLRDLCCRIEAVQAKIEMPSLRRKYQGKYFVYKNSASGLYWNIYCHCKRVVSTSSAIVDSFESSRVNRNENTFKCSQVEYFSLLQKEITKNEYEEALKKFIKSLQTLKSKS